MFTKRELENAIAEYENKVNSYSDCQKLATYYTLYNQHFADNEPKAVAMAETEIETVIDDYGDSDFFQTIVGRNAHDIWLVMDELMEMLKLTNPRLYDCVMRKLK